ncbi:MAG: response regulator [Cryomorphaceae bacterium]|nr:response regulator [Cryomorphaceae bacterium]
MMPQEKIRVLYLDDEENNLISFKAAFRRDFDVFTTTNANEAVQILSDNEIHVAISDQKMPNISGVEFFELIVPDFPEPTRMLLTGYADIEAVIDAINKGQVFRYIPKPWNEQELRITIMNAYELYASRQALKKKNEDLEKALGELEKFVYSASHDLRAPLVSILGVVKVARAENIGGTSGEYFGMIEKSVKRLDGFVQNIISYYQNRKQGEVLADIQADILLDEVIEHYRYFDGAEKINIQKSANQSGPIRLDELRLKMILNNLISNSIKYADLTKDQPFLKLMIEANEKVVRLIVEDNGQGINREDQKKVFDMFFRSNDSKLGSGIGLYIVKEAADKMGGKIHLSSELRQGAKFEIELPNRL